MSERHDFSETQGHAEACPMLGSFGIHEDEKEGSCIFCGSKPVESDAFHSHLDDCQHCANNPFDLCPIGLPLFQAAGQEAAAYLAGRIKT